MRVALGIEYAGSSFCGFQSQPAGCGVQDCLERAVEVIAGHPVTAVAAGRTDAGVHATLQVVHFDTGSARPVSAWVRGVNAHLPPAIAILFAQPVADEFHARFCATARHYTYLLLNRPERPGLLAGRVGWYHRSLDAAAMHAAAQTLLGTHDFTSFRAAQCQAKSPVKTVRRIGVTAHGDLLRIDVTASAFLHHMVRNIVGALVRIGSGRAPVTWMTELLAARDRTRGAPTCGAQGLYFTGVDYDARFGLPDTRRDLVVA